MECVLPFLVGAILAAGQEQPVTFGTTVVVPGGLEGVVYHISKRSKVIPDLRKIKPQGKIYVSALNIPLRDFTEGFPGVTKREEWFAIDYTGRFWIQNPGLYAAKSAFADWEPTRTSTATAQPALRRLSSVEP